jgi:serine/threonine protein kinase/TolB-like protein/Tfp pilus assembly protein PilF
MAGRASDQDLLIGGDLGHYHIEEKIGAGGMGDVYRAHDRHLDRGVAIKVLPARMLADESARKRFHKEALALSKLNHPNIATIYDFDTEQGVDFLAMELIPGITLSHKLAPGPQSEKEALRLGIQLADGLAYAHEHGVIHCDLKPGNLRLTADGWLKILDFGLAKFRQQAAETAETQSALQSGSISGTLPYMAPEQLLGEPIDARTDIHAAGLVLYEMATGKRAFSEVPTSQLIGAILHHDPTTPRQLNANLSSELEWIVRKCLERNPGDRYQSARELAADLRRLERTLQAQYPPETVRTEPMFSSVRRHGTLLFSLLAIVIVALLMLPGMRSRPASGVLRFQAIAVLPLVNLSGDPEREFFADGMTEELITQLGKVVPSRVIARQSVMQFKGTKLPLAEIAQKLKVDAIVEGSVVQAGSRVRVTARLVDAAAEKPVWTDEYDRDLRDVLTLQGEVTRAIASEIRATLSPQEQARLTVPRAVNPEAYEAYLKGRFEWYKVSKQGFENAERYFQLALKRDPNYALAYSGLADVWLMRADTGYAAPSETIPKAKTAALKALELDASLSEPHISLANIEASYERNWSAAERDFRRAIQLNPSSANAHFMYADYLLSFKRNPEWEREIQQALTLDPMNSFQRCFYGWHLIYVGRYDEAIDVLQKVAAAQPNFSSVHMGLWGAYYKKQMPQEAMDEAIRFFEALNDQEAVAALQSGYHDAGYREGMKRAADTLARRAQHSHVAGVRIARLYAHAGATDQALAWLEKAYEAKETPLGHLAVAWDWEAMRSDPRMQDLLRRMGLPQ